ncbi:UDP-glycosyltransferase UGT5-like isoform X2 [Anthonomus grandis grandis]|uniref:UDP-glycosyltransferase UGT5-like isoform X2 n=1 Tax=Anthonomus grandis grandis TaxID=2921223 RepID=UPI0021651242|nr:UDP-glycosyltransferase UGT5-like isoform X2 [Anthonomus grandis grandis]
MLTGGVFLQIFVGYLACGNAMKILGIYTFPWGSHMILGTKLMRGLSLAGHDVTLITATATKDMPKEGQWKEVVIDGMDRHVKELTIHLTKTITNTNKSRLSAFADIKIFSQWVVKICNASLSHPKIKEMIRSREKFDAIILDQFLNDCQHVFPYLFEGHLIVASTLGANLIVNGKVGNPHPIATAPMGIDSAASEADRSSLYARFKSVLIYSIRQAITFLFILPRHDQAVHDNYPDTPSIFEMYYNVSLVLLNSHPSFVEAVPLVPNMVEVGGFHIDPPKQLPEDLLTIMDKAKDGVIYFSLGSELKSESLPKAKIEMLLNVFKSLKQTVLWKFEAELEDKPDNVMIRKWMPQNDVLAHPNLKLFITHGGLLSLTESIYHGVPVLAIPFVGDQVMNADHIVQTGIGLKVDFQDENVSEEMLKKLIREVLDNPKYKENVQKFSKIYHDRPMSPMATAVYWIEYVIRHNGAHHLRVAGVGMPLYQYLLLDVLLIVLVVLLGVFFAFKWVFRQIFRNKTSKKVKKA